MAVARTWDKTRTASSLTHALLGPLMHMIAPGHPGPQGMKRPGHTLTMAMLGMCRTASKTRDSANTTGDTVTLMTPTATNLHTSIRSMRSVPLNRRTGVPTTRMGTRAKLVLVLVLACRHPERTLHRTKRLTIQLRRQQVTDMRTTTTDPHQEPSPGTVVCRQVTRARRRHRL